MPKKSPIWEMDSRERDASPTQRAATQSGNTGRTKRISALQVLQEEPTPPPHDISAVDAWEHTSSLARRTADSLMEIAKSAGEGMEVGDEVRQNKKDIAAVNKKLKWWQALAVAAITAAGSALFGVARLLYARGAQDGVNEMRLKLVEIQVQKNVDAIEKLRDEDRYYPMRRFLDAPDRHVDDKLVDPVRKP